MPTDDLQAVHRLKEAYQQINSELSKVVIGQQKVIEELSRPIPADERELTVTPSIGIAVFPDDGRDAETLIRNSDAAMYHAKQMGRANYQFFTAEMNQAASRRIALESDLRRALGKDELRVHYQPVVDARSGRVSLGVVGIEQSVWRRLLDNLRQLPPEVHRVLHTDVEALSTHR